MTCTYVKLDINYSVGSDSVHKLKSSSFLLEVLVFEWFEVWFLFLAITTGLKFELFGGQT